MNKIQILGRMTADAELKYTPGAGTAVANFTLAVDRRFQKDGKKEADFIPVVVWGKDAENVAKFTAKGKLIAIAGRIQVRNYDAKDGSKRYITEVISEEVQFIEWADKPGDLKTDQFEDLKPVDDANLPW